MSSSVYLSIVDSRDGAVLVSRWLGGNALVEAIGEHVGTTTFGSRGYESWAITPQRLDPLESSFYAGAPDAAEIARWTSDYGGDEYWWMLERDF